MSTSSVGLREAQIQHRPSDWPPATNLDEPSAVGEQRWLRRQAGRALVLESDGLHLERHRAVVAHSPARGRSEIASSNRRGVTGNSAISTPSWRSASLTALAIAAGGAIAPPSPMPFCPNSV